MIRWAVLLLFGVAQCAAAFGPYQATYIRTVDGDTFDVLIETYPDDFKQVRVRLAKYDTPETRSARCASERALGITATGVVKGILSNAKSIVIRLQTVDSFKRPVSFVDVDGEDLGEQLFALGLARLFKRGRNENWCSSVK